MKKWFKINALYVIGAFAGAVAGFFYWNFVGCISGTCAITSDPLYSTLYGALLGGIIFGLFRTDIKSSPGSIKLNNQ